MNSDHERRWREAYRNPGFVTPFDHITDVNELVLAARADWAAKNDMPAEPMDEETAEDALMDLLYLCLGHWIIVHAQVPVDSKERVTEVIESMIAALRKLQATLPDDPETVKEDLRRLLRRQLISR